MNSTTLQITPELISKMSEHFAQSNHALFSELAISVSRFESPEIEFTMPYNGNFVSNPQAGAYPPGVYSILLDSVLGIGSLVAIGTPVPVATLSLTVEYIAPNERGESLRAVGWSEAQTDNVAYATGMLYGSSSGRLLARSNGAFAINTKGPGFGEHLLGTICSDHHQ